MLSRPPGANSWLIDWLIMLSRSVGAYTVDWLIVLSRSPGANSWSTVCTINQSINQYQYWLIDWLCCLGPLEQTVDIDWYCCLGPLEQTVDHFWLMCHQHKTTCIVMLCRCYENSRYFKVFRMDLFLNWFQQEQNMFQKNK